MDPADDDLIRRAQRGEDDAYAMLVQRHQQVAFRTAYAVCGDAAEAEDAAQEAFVKAHAALGRFRTGAPLRPWLLRIVANEARNRRRSAGRREHLALRVAALVPAPAPAPDAAVLLGDERSELAAAVGRLEAPHREVVLLRHVLELSEAECAAVLGVRPGTVKSRLSRALERLREDLGERDLDLRLRALAAEAEWPDTPDLAGAVAGRLAGGQRRPARRRPRRRVLIAALAALLLVPAAAAFGDDVLEWLGLRSVEVRREPELPPGARRPALDELGPPVTAAQAGRGAGFAPVVPPRLGPPDEIRERDGVVTLVYDGGALLLAQLRGALQEELVQKTVPPGGRVRRVPGGLFLSGPDHAYLYVRPDGENMEGRPFLAGNTLVVERGDLLLRLEGRELTADRALALLSRRE